jgi:mxaD protein
MANVMMKTTLQAPAAAAWKLIRDFGGVGKFLDAVQSVAVVGEGIGALRQITLKDGAVVEERLERLNDKTRTLVYSIASSPLPLDQYVATMTVKDLGPKECEVTWASEFEPKGAPEADARKFVEGVYAAGFAGLHKLLRA